MSKNFCKPITLFVMSVITIGLFNPSQAQSVNTSSHRAGGYELYLQPRYIDSKILHGGGSSKVELSDTWGLGIGFGYNYTAHWSIHFAIDWASTGYDATRVSQTGATETYASKLDTNSTTFTGMYNFFDKKLTPYVSGSLGWMFVDSNIPLAPPSTGCWWDYWYGYICSDQAPTKSETNFIYGAGLGLRFDATRSLFFRAEYSREWMDFDVNASEDFDVISFDVGWLFK